MAVLGTSGPNTNYGLRITKNGKTFEKWYGSDRVKRDEKHNHYVSKGAEIVQDIQKAK